MKTFEAHGLPWLPTPGDGWLPLPRGAKVRVLTEHERDSSEYAGPRVMLAWISGWDVTVGWYPVHADGTDDHETAKRFITEDTFTPCPPRKREIRRRFKLSTKRSIIKHHP